MPEALPGTLRAVAKRLSIETVDRVWLFPPLVRGRREWGLVALSCFVPPAEGEASLSPSDSDRRLLFTASYSAERTGKGLTLVPMLSEEGAAPLDRLPRVMDGVVRRSREAPGDPREVAIGGDVTIFDDLVAELEDAIPEDVGRIGGP